MRECFETAARRHEVHAGSEVHRARVEAEIRRDYDLLNVPADARIVRLVTAAARRLGCEVRVRATGGGCDANVLNGKGLQIANLGTGMREIHTVKEWIDLRDARGAAARWRSLSTCSARTTPALGGAWPFGYTDQRAMAARSSLNRRAAGSHGHTSAGRRARMAS